MYHKSGKVMFSALKFHAIDYLYEDKYYYHDGSFADDKYRRPWTRVSVDSSQIMMNFSVRDYWKEYLYIEDFLEKKPISSTLVHIHNEDIEVVPSSNPCSQFDLEDVYLLMKDDEKEKFTCKSHNIQPDYVPVVLKKEEDLYIEDELIFTDDLAQYAKWLPNLRILLSRLSIFRLQDPLLNSKGDTVTEDDVFRECFTFERNITSEAKGKELYEDFCKVILSDEKELVLPLKLQSYKTSNLRLNSEIPTCLELKTLLQVTVEVITNESESYKISSDEQITPEIEISKYCSTKEVCVNESKSPLEFSKSVSDISFPAGELEVPLTPPCRSEKVHINSLYLELQPEPVSPFTKSILITKSTQEYLEDLVWQSEKYQNAMNYLLLTEPQAFVPICQQLPVTELKKLLSIYEDNSVFSALEEDMWINLREHLTLPCVLETLNTDLGGGESFACTNVEEFSKMDTFHLQKMFEEKNSIPKTKMQSVGALDDCGTKDASWFPQKKETFPSLPFAPTPSVHGHRENISTEEHTMEDTLQSGGKNPLHVESLKEKENVQIKSISCFGEPKSTSGNKKIKPFELPQKCRDDFDLLSNFIMLRSKHKIIPSEEANNVVIQEKDAKGESPTLENHNSPVVFHATVPMEKQTKENEKIAFIQIKASDSQFEAYCILETRVAPVLKELLNLGIHDWRFATLNFDDTRFFLKQQEKAISDTFKQDVTGTKNAKEITLFKHAAILHLLVTVRDLLLTCSLNTALEYLHNAKDRYKGVLGSSMDNIWRQLKIVQFARPEEYEASPKLTELQLQMFKWMQSNTNEQHKALIVTRMEFDDETAALIKTISTVQGLKVVYLNSEKRGTLLDSKNVISSLDKYSCMVVHNYHIGPDFPWTNFSLVVDYNYSENSCWMDLCKNLNISYITFRTAIPETVGIEEDFPDNFGHVLLKVQIPYVFLTSEGLLNTPEILQLLESKYNITFIERSCCEALQLFGSTDRYVVMTVDECTAIVMQNIEELKYEKSSDNIMLRLMALSLQYSCCWFILYTRERLNSDYSLAGKTLHHLVLIYAALVPFAQKSEDFEVKVALTPGVEETALLVRQIADYILLTSKRHPQEWLDKSWLSVLPSEAEKCLLTFPCMNPLVAQVMLKKSSSLEWLLSASFDQLQELLPEVPEKVLKHFSDITSLYTLHPSTESNLLEKTMPLQDTINSAISSCSQATFSDSLLFSSQRHHPFDEYSGCVNKVQNSKSCSPGYYQNESYTPPKPNTKYSLMRPSVSYQQGICSFQEEDHNIGVEGQWYLPFLKNVETEKRVNSSLLTPNTFGRTTHINFEAKRPSSECNQDNAHVYFENCPQNGTCPSKVTRGQKRDVPALIKNPTCQDNQNLLRMKQQPSMKQCNSSKDSKRSWYLVSNREDLPFQQSSGSFLGEFGKTAYSSPEFQSDERLWNDYPSTQTMDFSLHNLSFCKEGSIPGKLFQITGEYTEKKQLYLLPSNRRKQDVPAAGLEYTRIPQLKKRRLTFEKDPGRSDGQTRLKFF